MEFRLEVRTSSGAFTALVPDVASARSLVRSVSAGAQVSEGYSLTVVELATGAQASVTRGLARIKAV